MSKMMVAAVVLLGCKPPPPAPIEITNADPVFDKIAERSIEEAEPEPAPPLEQLSPLALSPDEGRAATELARKRARAVEVSADGEAFAFYGLGATWIVSPERPQGYRVSERAVKARFSSDHGKLALLTGKGVVVVSTATGKVLMRWPGGKAERSIESWRWEARFVSEREMLMFDGCRLWLVDSEGAATIGSDVCGEPRASLDGRRWLVMATESVGRAARERHGLSCPPTCRGVGSLHALDPATGDAIEIWRSERGVRVLHALAVSPDLRWFCAAVSERDHKLVCRAFDGSAEIAVWDGPTDGRAVFDATGQRLVFGAGAPRTERPLHVVDFGARTIQHIGAARADEQWYSFTSPSRLVTTGGEQVFVYDLERATKTAVGTPGEWEGFAVIPGQDRRFLVGRDVRGSRDFFWVELRER